MQTQLVHQIPIFEDNYVFVLVNDVTKTALVVDPGESTSIMRYIDEEKLSLKGILLTHHHHDHIGGAQDLQNDLGAPVYAPLKNKNQIPFADHYLTEGEKLEIDSFHFQIIELPGHTLGHIAYWEKNKNWLFSGDVLFGLGCGRLFEGTYSQAYTSLQRIKNLPPETLIYCTHEYTETNLQFCHRLSRMDDSPITGDDENLELYANELRNKRSLNLASVPLKLSIESKVNPFLLAKDVSQFTYLRELRNKM